MTDYTAALSSLTDAIQQLTSVLQAGPPSSAQQQQQGQQAGHPWSINSRVNAVSPQTAMQNMMGNMGMPGMMGGGVPGMGMQGMGGMGVPGATGMGGPSGY